MLILCFTLFSMILLNYEKSNWFFSIFTSSSFIDLPKQFLSLVEQTLRLFGEYIFRSSRAGLKKVALNNVAKFTGPICAGVSFSINCKLEVYSFIRRETLANVSSREFCKIFFEYLYVEYLRNVTVVYCSTNIKQEKSLHVDDLLAIHVI